MSLKDWFSSSAWFEEGKKHAENFKNNLNRPTVKSAFTVTTATLLQFGAPDKITNPRDAVTGAVGKAADKMIGNQNATVSKVSKTEQNTQTTTSSIYTLDIKTAKNQDADDHQNNTTQITYKSRNNNDYQIQGNLESINENLKNTIKEEMTQQELNQLNNENIVKTTIQNKTDTTKTVEVTKPLKYNETKLWNAGEKIASGAIEGGTWIFWHGVSKGLSSGLQAMVDGKGLKESFKIGAHEGIEQVKYDGYMISEGAQTIISYAGGYTVGLAGDAVAWGWSNTFGRFENAVAPSGEDVDTSDSI